MSRFDALAAINQRETVLAETALVGIDLKIAMIAVWGVHYERYEQALMRCEARGVTLSEAELYELSGYYRREWRIDEARSTRPNCFLCNRELPVHMERLCQCFRAAEVGVFVKPTQENIAWLQKQHPRDWESIIMETIACVRCADTEEIPASIVAASLRQGKAWIPQSRKFCQNCYQKHRMQMTSSRPPSPSSRPPAPPSSRPPAKPISVRPQRSQTSDDIGTIQQMVASSSPPVGES